jgi:hypothetical protein
MGSPIGADLEGALRDLGAHVELPHAPPLAARVGDALRARPRRARLGVVLSRLREPRRGLAVAVLCALVLLGALLTFSPAMRSAVADWLGVGGIRIRVRPGGTPPPNLGATLDLGRRTSLAQARAEVSFDVAVPRAPRVGAPDAIYVDDLPSTGRVTLLYRPDERLPRAHATGVGMLVTQFEATVHEELIDKLVFEGAAVEPVTVGEARGYWIGGPPHAIYYLQPDGDVIMDSARLAANTLVWQRDGVTLRLESSLTRRRALHIARSIR